MYVGYLFLKKTKTKNFRIVSYYKMDMNLQKKFTVHIALVIFR